MSKSRRILDRLACDGPATSRMLAESTSMLLEEAQQTLSSLRATQRVQSCTLNGRAAYAITTDGIAYLDMWESADAMGTHAAHSGDRA